MKRFVHLVMLVVWSFGCGGPQHTWDQNAHIAVNSSLHVLRDADIAITELYEREAARAQTIEEFERVDARYAPIAVAERTALNTLILAEHAIDTAVATGQSPDKCRVQTLLLRARVSTDDVARIATGLGIQIPDTSIATLHTIESVAASLAPSCPSSSAPPSSSPSASEAP